MRLHINEQDKSFLLSLAYATGIILMWKGIWEGVGEVPYIGFILGNPFVSLFIGLTILTLTGWIYRQFDAFSLRTNKLLDTLSNVVHDEAKGAEHFISYFDELTNKHHKVAVKHVRRVEQNHVVMMKEGREFFIPIHRISAVHKGGRAIWRK
jgi:uncharacterized protein (UPF0248 family)